MCRIAGLITNRLEKGELKHTIKVMCDSLQHGGPDDEGIFCSSDARVAFGHRRLSIIDLSKSGHQPMPDKACNAWITFNGEIYNYPELKAQLQMLGSVFTTATDTEVIIQAYLHWGTKSFNMLRGMFAFALYDTITETVYLVRDTSGIKPLYYCIDQGELSFASEIKAFKAAGIATDEDQRWPIWLLAFGHIPEPYTTLRKTANLPKGHFLKWSKNGTYTLTDYTSTDPEEVVTDFMEALDGIRFYLKAAIKRQLIADAPIGVFLSGGIDSGVLALLANMERKQLKTVSIFFDERKYDERRYQNVIAEHINGENFTHLIKQKDLDEYLPQILEDMDMPTTDGINSWFISRYARQDGLKAVLSGVGADELFGGYPSFNRIQLLGMLRKTPSFLFSLFSLFEGSKFKKAAYLKEQNPIADYLFLRGLFAPGDIARLIGTTDAEVNRALFADLQISSQGPYDKLKAAWMETNIYMQNQLLRDTDVMSMRHGLEVRVPFLDEDLQRYVARLASSVRFDKEIPKKILIDSFKDILPETVWNRPKMGFTFPLQQWMKKNEYISDEALYNGRAAKKLINNFNRGQLHWSRAFALYQVQGHV